MSAAKALSQWGDPRSVTSLKDLLATVAAKPVRWSAAGAIARSLMPHLQASDLAWAVDVFVRQARSDNRSGLGVLFEAFEPDAALKALSGVKTHGGKVERDVKAEIDYLKYRASR